jgi:hypothetical protein
MAFNGCTHGEEPNTGDDDGANMVPAERGLVDLRQRETSSLIGIRDVGVVVVEVVEGSVASCSSGRHCGQLSLRGRGRCWPRGTVKERQRQSRQGSEAWVQNLGARLRAKKALSSMKPKNRQGIR